MKIIFLFTCDSQKRHQNVHFKIYYFFHVSSLASKFWYHSYVHNKSSLFQANCLIQSFLKLVMTSTKNGKKCSQKNLKSDSLWIFLLLIFPQNQERSFKVIKISKILEDQSIQDSLCSKVCFWRQASTKYSKTNLRFGQNYSEQGVVNIKFSSVFTRIENIINFVVSFCSQLSFFAVSRLSLEFLFLEVFSCSAAHETTCI